MDVNDQSTPGQAGARGRLARTAQVARAARDRVGGGRGDRVEAELAALRARVAELEDAIVEARRHQLRVAELTDVVQALLVPLATADRDGLEDVLRRYSEQLG